MVPIDLEALITRACNGYQETPDIGLNLDIADVVKQKPSNARKALDKILKIVSDEIDRQASFLAIQLLDCLVVNCGYSVRFYMTRKEYLNLLVKKFPPSPSFQLDHAMKRTLKLINKWKLSLCDKSRYKKDFSNIILMYDLLVSKHYIFPPVSSDEIDAMVGLELQTLRTKESLLEEEKSVLETKLEYYLWKGGPNDIKKANEIMKQMIETQVQDPSKYSSADSQIMQDLQKLTEKLSLIEDLVNNEDDSSSLQCLLDNPTIGQMYKACRDELPKLLELANSELNEDLMMRIINITERLTNIKKLVEEPKEDQQKERTKSDNVPFELKHSSDDIKNIFDDLPLLSPKPHSELNNNHLEIKVTQEYFKNNQDLLIDLIKLNDKYVLRIMNITSDKIIKNLKMNGKLVKANFEPLDTFTRTIQNTNESVLLEYNENDKFELTAKSNEMRFTDEGIENLLLI